MTVEAFVHPNSIVRRIWGDADLVLLVFAGAAAEFALNRAVDWLFFTGKVPRNPLQRLLSTAHYAQQIALADRATAELTLQKIRTAHAAVERERGTRIPDWAHRDVLYLLVEYSERAFRMLYRPLRQAEQQELWEAFRRVGTGLGIPELPLSYTDWRIDRERHLERDLIFSEETAALYAAYRRHLGSWRYALLRQVQAALLPERVRRLLNLPQRMWLRRLLPLYPVLAELGLRSKIQWALIPPEHRAAVQRLDHPGVRRAEAVHRVSV